MIIVLIRSVILYVLVLISMRIMGKGQLGELQPIDMVVTLMVSELAVLPMEDLDAPLIHGPIAIVTLMALQVLISYINIKSNVLRGVICGKPIILYEHGKFNERSMVRLRVTANDIFEQLRIKGYDNINDVDYVIIESNGKMSVLGPQKIPEERCKRLPISIILDGKLLNENIRRFQISENLVHSELLKNSLVTKDVMFAYVDEDDKFIFFKRKDSNTQ